MWNRIHKSSSSHFVLQLQYNQNKRWWRELLLQQQISIWTCKWNGCKMIIWQFKDKLENNKDKYEYIICSQYSFSITMQAQQNQQLVRNNFSHSSSLLHCQQITSSKWRRNTAWLNLRRVNLNIYNKKITTNAIA
jgi:hypothetical protein